jgi:hypothetical protein
MAAKSSLEGFKWPVAAERTIAVPAGDLWSIISRPGNLESCHPFCARNPVHRWPGPDAEDEVHYLSGWIYRRRFRAWREGEGYDLEILREARPIAQVRWQIASRSAGESVLGITVYPKLLQRVPLPLRWLLHRTRLRPPLEFYLESVVRGFEWYLVRGEAVPRDQFGKHPWYSAA